MQRSDTAEKGGTFLVEHSGFPSPSVSMDVLANHSIFQELQIVHDTGYFSAMPSLEENWQQTCLELERYLQTEPKRLSELFDQDLDGLLTPAYLKEDGEEDGEEELTDALLPDPPSLPEPPSPPPVILCPTRKNIPSSGAMKRDLKPKGQGLENVEAMEGVHQAQLSAVTSLTPPSSPELGRHLQTQPDSDSLRRRDADPKARRQEGGAQRGSAGGGALAPGSDEGRRGGGCVCYRVGGATGEQEEDPSLSIQRLQEGVHQELPPKGPPEDTHRTGPSCQGSSGDGRGEGSVAITPSLFHLNPKPLRPLSRSCPLSE
ncbi:Krueppel-like factor 7 [Dissostichus eleginoides]|uniref:Krueppel-like factor 7 n=1 Tax=Dissostichus eleginoides TaxID=100907 RepID=A0AAD9B378_DISEL|nr:Krueppel-like factor 7 [Dissostichus eleginoides]